jgi:hypothetical protein
MRARSLFKRQKAGVGRMGEVVARKALEQRVGDSEKREKSNHR